MVFGLVVLIATSCQVDMPQLTTNIERIEQLAAEIADFETPTGYEPEYGGSWQGATLVAYHVGSGPRHLMFLQAEEGSDLAELDTEAALAEVTSGEESYYSGLTEVEVREVVVRAETTSLVVSEGVNGEGVAYRQVTASFTGNGGPALVSLTGPVDGWDWATVEAFLASIR
jgi:hypothetical protein